jgi:hypothetical protein
MKLRQIIQSCVLAALMTLGSTGVATAAPAHYKITLDTAALVGMGPFSIAFQLADVSGTGDANNNFKLSAFNFHGGSADGGLMLFGGASGNLSTSVNLVDSDPFFNAFVQSFIAGTSLSFEADFTNNSDGGAMPDLFTVSLLDGLGVGIPTLDPTGNDTFLTFGLIGGPGPSILTAGSDVTRTTFALAAPLVVPEPSSILLVAASLGALVLARRRGALSSIAMRPALLA